MSVEQRRIYCYFLGLETKVESKDGSKPETENIFNKDVFLDFISYCNALDEKEKLSDIRRANKVVMLGELKVKNKKGKKLLRGIVYSGKYNHSPDYLSIEDGTTRPTEKRMSDAYKEKTHFLGDIQSDGIELLYESRQAGAGIGMTVQNLNKLYNKFVSDTGAPHGYFYSHIIAIDDVENKIKSLSRISAGSIYVDKKLLGTDSFNMTQQEISQLKSEVIVNMKAARERSIPRKSGIDLLRQAASSDSEIKRVRLVGKGEHGEVIIDSFLTKKYESISAELDSKGLVDDVSIFSKLEELMEGSE